MVEVNIKNNSMGMGLKQEADTAICIDLYHFEGDGKPVCDGLKPCTVTFDDGTQDTGWLFCMHYYTEEPTPLLFVL